MEINKKITKLLKIIEAKYATTNRKYLIFIANHKQFLFIY